MASIATDAKTVQHFWGMELGPKNPKFTLSLTQAELQITQATLVGAHGASATILRASTPFVEPIPLCQLGGGDLPRSVLLDLNFFPEDETVTLSVEGPGSLALAGTLAVIGELEGGEKEEEGGGGGGGGGAAKSVGGRKTAWESPEKGAAKGKPAPTFVEMEEEEGDDDEDDAVDQAEQDAMLGSFDEEEEGDDEDDDEEEGGEDEGGGNDDEKPAAAAPKRKREGEAAAAAAAAAAATKPPPQQKAKGGAAAPAAATPASPSGGTWAPVAQSGGKVQFKDVVVGAGPEARKGARITVGYRGTLKSGKEFDKNSKFNFKLGVGDVIKGWDMGVVGMRVGGTRELIIHSGALIAPPPPFLLFFVRSGEAHPPLPTTHPPADFAYGAKGAGRDIPPHSALRFTVELKGVQQQ
jgi:FKBP-type peptidyl-prolyl cis-trans isomerase